MRGGALPHWHSRRPACTSAGTSSSWNPTLWTCVQGCVSPAGRGALPCSPGRQHPPPPPPHVLHCSLPTRALLRGLRVTRALIIFQIRGRLSQALSLDLAFYWRTAGLTSDVLDQHVSNDKGSAAHFSPNRTSGESSLAARKEGSLTQTRKRTVYGVRGLRRRCPPVGGYRTPAGRFPNTDFRTVQG